MLLFFFLLLMLAIAWGVADHFQSLLHKPPPAATPVTVEAASRQAPAVVRPANPAAADNDPAEHTGGSTAATNDGNNEDSGERSGQAGANAHPEGKP